MQRTVINDDGEEVTEDVWEEVAAEEDADVHPSPGKTKTVAFSDFHDLDAKKMGSSHGL